MGRGNLAGSAARTRRDCLTKMESVCLQLPKSNHMVTTGCVSNLCQMLLAMCQIISGKNSSCIIMTDDDCATSQKLFADFEKKKNRFICALPSGLIGIYRIRVKYQQKPPENSLCGCVNKSHSYFSSRVNNEDNKKEDKKLETLLRPNGRAHIHIDSNSNFFTLQWKQKCSNDMIKERSSFNGKESFQRVKNDFEKKNCANKFFFW